MSKSVPSGFSLRSLALAGAAAFVLGNYRLNQMHAQKIDAIRASMAELRSMNAEVESMLRLGKQAYDEIYQEEEGKIFNYQFKTKFNVEPIEENQYEPGVLDRMRGADIEQDPYYITDAEGYKHKSELYAGYPTGNNYDRMIYVKWSGPKVGYGVFANVDLPKGQFLGDYTGVVVSDSFNTDYMWVHPFREKTAGGLDVKYGIDARHTGNILRFVNALTADKLNCQVVYYLRDKVWHVGYRTTKVVAKGEQLFVSYGDAYWKARTMTDPTVEEDDQVKTEEESSSDNSSEINQEVVAGDNAEDNIVDTDVTDSDLSE